MENCGGRGNNEFRCGKVQCGIKIDPINGKINLLDAVNDVIDIGKGRGECTQSTEWFVGGWLNWLSNSLGLELTTLTHTDFGNRTCTAGNGNGTGMGSAGNWCEFKCGGNAFSLGDFNCKLLLNWCFRSNGRTSNDIDLGCGIHGDTVQNEVHVDGVISSKD